MTDFDQETGDVVSSRTSFIRMPPEISKAIIAVKKEVKSLQKEDENKFAKFKYTSVDTFYESIGPMMAKAGLFLVIDELSAKIEQRESTDEQGRTRISNWLLSVLVDNR